MGNTKTGFIMYHDLCEDLHDFLSFEQMGKFLWMCHLYDQDTSLESCLMIAHDDIELQIAFKMRHKFITQNKEAWERTRQGNSKGGKNHTGNQYTRRKKMEVMEVNSQNGSRGSVTATDTDTATDNVNVTDKVSVCNTRTTEQIIAEYQSEQHKAWHESLCMTYRLEMADVMQCIADGVHYCINMGMELTISNIKRYTTTACKQYKPARKPLQERKVAFATECKSLHGDSNMIAGFYEYYTQPTNDNPDVMLFEAMAGWNTSTRFKMWCKNDN